MHYAINRGHGLVLLLLASLLTGCLALPQPRLFTFQPEVTSLGIEDVHIGSGLHSGSLPVQATLAVGLSVPMGTPAVQMSGFRWTLDVPGVDPVKGHYQQEVTLTPGDDAALRLPVTLDLLALDMQRMAPLLKLASQLALQGELPPGSELAITPGRLRGLGMTLPTGLLAPTIRLSVGDDGQLVTQR